MVGLEVLNFQCLTAMLVTSAEIVEKCGKVEDFFF